MHPCSVHSQARGGSQPQCQVEACTSNMSQEQGQPREPGRPCKVASSYQDAAGGRMPPPVVPATDEVAPAVTTFPVLPGGGPFGGLLLPEAAAAALGPMLVARLACCRGEDIQRKEPNIGLCFLMRLAIFPLIAQHAGIILRASIPSSSPHPYQPIRDLGDQGGECACRPLHPCHAPCP